MGFISRCSNSRGTIGELSVPDRSSGLFFESRLLTHSWIIIINRVVSGGTLTEFTIFRFYILSPFFFVLLVQMNLLSFRTVDIHQRWVLRLNLVGKRIRMNKTRFFSRKILSLRSFHPDYYMFFGCRWSDDSHKFPLGTLSYW